VDLRHAVDVLLARLDVDPRRLAYVGSSFGGTRGGLPAAVEDRIRVLEAHVDTWSAQRWKEFYAEYDLQARVTK